MEKLNRTVIVGVVFVACVATGLLKWSQHQAEDLAKDGTETVPIAANPMTASSQDGGSEYNRDSGSPEVAKNSGSIRHVRTATHASQPLPERPQGVLRAAQGGTLGQRTAPLPRGKAKLQIGERKITPKNLSGHYQRVLVEGESETSVELQWAGAGNDRPVFVHAIHGGLIDGESSRTLHTDKTGRLAFNFTTNAEPGRYEVLLRSGPSEEVLQFWVPQGSAEIDRYGL